MAESFSSTQFSNLLSDLERDLDQQLEPSVQKSAQAVEDLLQQARERLRTTTEEVLQALTQARDMGAQVRNELETFERVHLQAAERSRTQLADSLEPLAGLATQTETVAGGVQQSLQTLDATWPQFSTAVDDSRERLAALTTQIGDQARTLGDDAESAAGHLGAGLGEQASAAEAQLAGLAEACVNLTSGAEEGAGRLASRNAEQLLQSAEHLRSGVRDAVAAADSASGLVRDGLEVFAGASEQMQALFGDRSEEVMGTVRRIADLVDAIRPFIDLAKSI